MFYNYDFYSNVPIYIRDYSGKINFKSLFLHCILSFMVAPSLSFFSTHVNQFVLYLTDPNLAYLFQDFYRRMQNQDCRVTASK